MFCGKCGNQVEPDALFCNVCGEKIVKYENIEELNNNSINEFSANKNSNVNPNNSQYSNNKATKTGLIIFISVAAIVIIIGIILGVVFVSKKIKNDKINKEIANEVMDATNELTDGVHDTFNNKSDKDSTKNTTTATSTKKIGSSKYGYLKVEDNWQSYVDSEHPEILGYELDSNWAICMASYPSSTISAREYANNVKELLKSKGIIPMDINDKVGSYNAYRISGYYTEYNRYIKIWCFETGDGNTRYISIEGPDSVGDKYDIINTYTLY